MLSGASLAHSWQTTDSVHVPAADTRFLMHKKATGRVHSQETKDKIRRSMLAAHARRKATLCEPRPQTLRWRIPMPCQPVIWSRPVWLGDITVLCRSPTTASDTGQATPPRLGAVSRESGRQADRNALVIEKAVAEMTQLRTQLRADFAHWTAQYEAGN